jgi:hypothetical protein
MCLPQYAFRRIYTKVYACISAKIKTQYIERGRERARARESEKLPAHVFCLLTSRHDI